MQLKTLPIVALLLLASLYSTGQQSTQALPADAAVASPLSAYSAEWTKPVYAACNTAENAPYLTRAEKDLVYILNLIRRYPVLFLNTVVKTYPARTRNPRLLQNSYYRSLVAALQRARPLAILQPDNKCFQSAYCHALTSGQKGYDGHERQTPDCLAKTYFNGECADYGHKAPLDILLSLLIDEGVPSLGHRSICLSRAYSLIGVSIQPHIYYNYNAVLDFKID